MRSAHVDPAAVDSSAVGFRLAPRINAAGRLGRPDAALELILTDDPDQARTLAADLEELNRDRQAVEDRILREATALVEGLPEPARLRRGYVLWHEDWHEGVIGIVASRLVERFVGPSSSSPAPRMAGRAPDGRSRASTCTGPWRRAPRIWSGSGDTARPQACRSRRQPRGIRRGLRRSRGRDSRRRGSLPGDDCGRRRLGRGTHASARAGARPARAVRARKPRRDAARTGHTALCAGDRGEGKHLRFRVRQNGRDAGSAIAFGQGSQLDRLRATGLFDVACRLKENRWNGTIAPQLVVRRLFDTSEGYEALRERLAGLWRAGEGAWTPEARSVFAELGLAPTDGPPKAATRIGDVPRSARARDGRVPEGRVGLRGAERERLAWRPQAFARVVAGASVESGP